MDYYGYHRTTTKEQDLDRGLKEINEFSKSKDLYIKRIYTDQHTGRKFNRPRYELLKEDILREGDALIITEIDMLGRNKTDSLKELQYFKEKGIRIMVLEIPTSLMDLSLMDSNLADLMLETINNMLVEMYASFAQEEMDRREKRQKEGIGILKERGEWEKYGRPRVIEIEDFFVEYERVLREEIKPFELIKELDMNKSTYYSYRKLYHDNEDDERKEGI